MKPTLGNLRKTVTVLGGHLEDDSAGRWRIYQMVAPDGKVWSGHDVGIIPVLWLAGTSNTEAITSALNDIKYGVGEEMDEREE